MTLDLVALTKPRITLMTLLVAGGCMMLAEAHFSLPNACLALLGIALLVSGSSAFNMYIEREHDKLMDRTRNRPLPAGRLKPAWALWVGFVTSILAMPALVLSTNWLTAWIGFGSLIAYVLIYTPMKRLSTWALVIGAFPGAAPALMGYTAVSGKIDITGLALFGLAFFWQLPHFIAIGIFRKEEYTKAGFPVIAQVTGEPLAIILTVLTTVLIVINAGFLWWLEVGGVFYG
ncbi:MAG: heme o synthase, partial [Myxococcaceae bacterium]